MAYGIRTNYKDYEQAWKSAYPERTVPLQIKTELTYKLEHLPFGCTREMVENRGQALSWPIKGIRKVEGRACIIGAAHAKPDGPIAFNGEIIIATQLPQKTTRDTGVLAGPRPRPNTGSTSSHKEAMQADAWGAYISRHWGSGIAPINKPPAPKDNPHPRTVDGPTEKRFEEQEQRIMQLEKSLDKQIEQTAKNTKDMKDAVETRLQESDKIAQAFRQEIHQGVQTQATDLTHQTTTQMKTGENNMAKAMQEVKVKRYV